MGTTKIVEAKIGNNSYYTLAVIGNNSTQNKFFENLVIGQMENGETTYYLFRYYFNNKIYNNQDEINIASLEKAEMKPLNALSSNFTKGYDCITTSTTYCDWGGETHIAGPNCKTTYTSTHTYCIQTVDYYTYSDFINSGGGGSNGGNGPEYDFIDPNDPYTQPITTPEMYAGALNYHLLLNTAEHTWTIQHTSDASQILEFLDNKNFSTSSKGFAKNIVSIYTEMGGPGQIKSIIASGVTNTAEYVHQFYLRMSSLVALHPEYLSYANYFIDILRNTAAKVINTNPSYSNWVDLTNMWLFELGPNPINFTDGNYTVNKLKNLQGTNNARTKAKNSLNSGIFNITETWIYNQEAFYTGMSEANLATSFLGTYKVEVHAFNISGNQYQLNFVVTNTSSWESATRLRIDHDHDNNHDAIIPNKYRGEGLNLGGNFEQSWNWSETVKLP